MSREKEYVRKKDHVWKSTRFKNKRILCMTDSYWSAGIFLLKQK